ANADGGYPLILPEGAVPGKRFLGLSPFAPAKGGCFRGAKDDLLARLQGQHGEGGAGVADEVFLVVVDRAGEPAAGGTLIARQPGGAAADLLVINGQAGLAKDVDDQAGAVAVARS